MTAPRRFLFLQGMPGSSFWRIGMALRERGCEVFRVNLNGGDQADWRETAINYRGSAQDWPAALARILVRHGVTDIVLFGDCRPMHRAAAAVAATHGVVVHVFEEGYIRPDWVTLEQGGVNGHSALPKDPEWYRHEAAGLPAVTAEPALEHTFSRRARETILYNTAAIALAWSFPHYRTHRPWGALTEGFGWLKRMARRGPSRKQSRLALRRVDGRPYFLFAMQLGSDSQIRVHSPFAGMDPVLDLVIGSFAQYGQADTVLIVKAHPLDNGLRNWRDYVTRHAAARGVSDRVVYCDVGDIDQLVRGSLGLVTVNSTSGTLALAAGIAVVALGDAVYNLPGLTHQSGLDGFWRGAQPPSAGLYDAFRRVLADRSLVRGGFYSEEGLSLLAEGAAARILHPRSTATTGLARRAPAGAWPPLDTGRVAEAAE